MVVAAHPEAARIGASILAAGGNAADAACATAWALTVCEPAESGLGGQATALVREPSGEVSVLDGHSRAPRRATPERISARAQEDGIRATTVPSLAATLDALRARHGTLPSAAIIAPAANLAERGFRLTQLGRRQIEWTQKALARCPLGSARFLHGGSIPAEGSLLCQPELAATLGRLAHAGVDDFYRGATAALILRDMSERDGLISAEDLAEVRIVVREPIEISWQDHRILSAPPPAGGVQALLALRLLERPPVAELADAERAVARALALRLAFRERERWPDHPDDLTPAILRWLVSDERVDGMLERLASGADRTIPLDSLGEAGDTTHLSVTDASGRCVAITQSIQSVFGAKTGCAAAGFFYNNFLKTCPRERHAYRLRPRALPQSNAAPTIALARSGAAWAPRLLLGAAGSRRIASSIVQVIDATLGHGASLPEAVREPRLHALLDHGAWVEKPLLRGRAAAALEANLGPIRSLPELAYQAGAVHAIAFEGRLAVGAADPRRDGVAIAVDPPSRHVSRIERGRSPLL